MAALVAFRDISGIGLFDLGKSNFLGGIVSCANRFSALESHVLKHVGESGLTHGILDGARVHMGKEGEHGRLGTFTDHDGEAVVEFLHRSALLEGSEVLRASYRAEYEKDRDTTNKCL